MEIGRSQCENPLFVRPESELRVVFHIGKQEDSQCENPLEGSAAKVPNRYSRSPIEKILASNPRGLEG